VPRPSAAVKAAADQFAANVLPVISAWSGETKRAGIAAKRCLRLRVDQLSPVTRQLQAFPDG
jgi:hypothetical protein